MLPAEFHPVTPDSVHSALEARATELQAAAKANDGRIRKPADVVVMPKIARGSVDLRVRCSVALENLERQYGKELFWSRVELLREAK